MRASALLTVLIVTASIGGVVVSSINGAEPATGRASLVGAWRIEVFRDDGRDRLSRLAAGPGKKDAPPRVARLVITPDACQVVRGDGKREVQAGLGNIAWKNLSVDASGTPHQIDLVGFSGPNGDKEKTYLGIYSRTGDRLRIAWNEQGKTRPTELKSDGQTNLIECVLEK